MLSGLKDFWWIEAKCIFFRHLMWKIVGCQAMKGIHIENLFHLLIFSVDFLFEGVYNMRQVKTVGRSGSILFYFRFR